MATLATTIPGLSCERGTPERKIVDACSEAISEAWLQQYLSGSLLDMDNKVGLELEQFVGIWGFGRLQGKAAEGVIRMTTSVPSPNDQTLPVGSQFLTKAGLAGTANPLYFASKQAVVLVAGTFSVDVPVRCTVVGSQGNVPPDSVTSIGSVLATSSVTNLQAFTGGVDVETDQELRQRFKDTMLRNISGTADWYRSICLQNTRVSKVAVFGPTTLYKTQIEAPATDLNLSLHEDVKYAWPEMVSVFSSLGQEEEVFYNPTDDYVFTPGVSPVFSRTDTGQIETGQIIDLEFQYTTRSSRNDPANGITNKVDVFVDGIDSYRIIEKTVVSDTTLSSNSTDPLYTGNFERVGSAGSPSSSNRFTRLASVPIVDFPATITVDGTVYSKGTHYYVLKGTTTLRGSRWEVSGIEWETAGPANDTELTLAYIYNRVPEMLTAVIASGRQVCTDVMVHQADWRYVVACLSVEYSRNYSIQVVNAAISEQLKRYFAAMDYGLQLKISSLCLVVQQVLGVIDVKLTTFAENPLHYGIELYLDPSDSTPDSVETTDFKFPDNSLPVFTDVRVTRKATP